MSDTIAPVGVIEQIDVDRIIIVDDHNSRVDFDEQKLLNLGKSMEENTQLQPIIVNHIKNYYELVAGQRRLLAAKANGQKTIEAKVFEELTGLQATRMMLAENRDRQSLNVLEDAYGFERLFELGVSMKEIAESEHCSVDKVKKRFKLLELHGDVQDLIVRKQNPLPVNQALVIWKLPQDKQGEVARECTPLVGQVATEEMVREKVEDILNPPLSGVRDNKGSSDADGGGDDGHEPEANEGNKKKIEPDKLNSDGPEESQKPAGEKDEALEKAAKEMLKLKPVDAKLGICGKMTINDDGRLCLRNAVITINIGGKVMINTLQELPFDFEGDCLVEAISMIKANQPKPAKKKTAKKK